MAPTAGNFVRASGFDRNSKEGTIMEKPNEKPAGETMPSATGKPDRPEPDRFKQADAEDMTSPPARAGQSERTEKPTEGAGRDNPVHHTGRVPPQVTPGET